MASIGDKSKLFEIFNQGLLILPPKLNKSHLEMPNLSYNNIESKQLAVQMLCIHPKGNHFGFFRFNINGLSLIY